MGLHYRGTDLHFALCDALGIDKRERSAMEDVRQALTYVMQTLAHEDDRTLPAPVTYKRYKQVTSPHSNEPLMDVVMSWCALVGITVEKEPGHAAKFIVNHRMDFDDHTRRLC